MEEKMENEVLEEVETNNEDYEIIVSTEDEDDCDSGVYKGAAVLIGGLAIAGAVSIGRAVWKGIGKLRNKAAKSKASKDDDEEIIDVECSEEDDEDEDKN